MADRSCCTTGMGGMWTLFLVLFLRRSLNEYAYVTMGLEVGEMYATSDG